MAVPAQVQAQSDSADALFASMLNPTPAAPATPTPPETASQPSGSGNNGTDWKAEYDRLSASHRVLKGKYDGEVPRLIGELRAAQAEISALKASLGGAPGGAATPPAKTPVDRSEFADPMIRLVEDITSAATEPLKQELAARKQRDDQHDQQEADKRAYDGMLNKLDRIVPNWKAINDSPVFQAYCTELDSTTGFLRQDELGDAIKRRDAADVAAFFTAFIAKAPPSKTETQNTPDPRLAEQQVPGVTGSAARGGHAEKRTWTRAQVTGFYTAKSQGKFNHLTPAQLETIEADIYSAPSEGRVRD